VALNYWRVLAGFFADGEIGPIAGRALHTFTAWMALFVE
jgi:small ligand-binding sensory domain FIST